MAKLGDMKVRLVAETNLCEVICLEPGCAYNRAKDDGFYCNHKTIIIAPGENGAVCQYYRFREQEPEEKW